MKRLEERIDLRQGAQNAATAGQLGDYFQYPLDKPVTLARQKSAMLPIVNQDVEGQRVSIYNQNTHARFPLLGLKFKNSTGLHLMQGPITVFEGPSYAGDARILDVQPNEERLISYAIDRGTPRVERELVYVVLTEKGQDALRPEEFAQKYGWRNDPERVPPMGK